MKINCLYFSFNILLKLIILYSKYITSDSNYLSTINTTNKSFFSFNKRMLQSNNYNNFNEYNDLIISNLPPSFPIGRYSIGIWVFIDDIVNFDNGFNIIYEKHIALHITTNEYNQSNSEVMCIPQAYRQNILGLQTTSNIKDLLKKDQNSNWHYYTKKNTDKKWVFYFCSVNLPEGVFYVNNSIIQYIKPFFYLNNDNTSNTTYYKDLNNNIPDYKSGNIYSLIIEHANLSKTRLYFKHLVIFKDYIPQKLFKNLLFYKDFNLYLSSSPTKYNSLLLILNFGLNKNASNTFDGVLINNNDTIDNLIVSAPSILSKTYSNTESVYDLNLCNEKEEIDYFTIDGYIADNSATCKAIVETTGGTVYACDTSTSYCVGSDYR